MTEEKVREIVQEEITAWWRLRADRAVAAVEEDMKRLENEFDFPKEDAPVVIL